MTLTSGNRGWISSNTLTPSWSGISRSSRTISGCWLVMLLMASLPVPASPTIKRSGWVLSMLFSPSLTMRWSSTSNMRINVLLPYPGLALTSERNHRNDLRAAPKSTDDVQPASQQFQAFVHANNAEAAAFLVAKGDGGQIKPHSVVSNGQAQFVLFDAQFDIDVLCLSMLARVTERFLDDAIARQPHRWRNGFPERGVFGDAADAKRGLCLMMATILGPGGDQESQCVGQCAASEGIGAQIENGVTGLVEVLASQCRRSL